MKSPAAALFIAPMKALGVSELPAGGAGEWHGEIKFDGYRAIAVLNAGQVELWSRNRKRLDYPEVVSPLARLRCDNAVLDGEIVGLDTLGRSRFQVLQARDKGERPPIVYYVFDLLYLNGRSWLAEPWEARRAALEKLVKSKGAMQLSPAFTVEPAALMSAARQQGLEGIVLKRRGSVYESGRRSGAWLKVKPVNEQEFVIGGFTPPKNSRVHLGALLVGYYRAKKLLYAGKVGSGFDREQLSSLAATLAPLATERCPFANLPLASSARWGQGMTPAAMRDVTWLQPRLVAQIKFAEWTRDGLLRQPVFLGLRPDKAARDVRREAAAG